MLINKKSSHGGDIYTNQNLIDFSVNTNPFGVPDEVRLAMIKSIENIGFYPDPYCRQLREKTAFFKGVPADTILFGNGAAELIYQFVYSLPKDKTALIISPTFIEYELALQAAEINIEHYLLTAQNCFILDENLLDKNLLDKKLLDEKFSAVFLCSPNNPTGVIVDVALLEKLADTGIRIFCDVSFLELSNYANDYYNIPLLSEKYPNITFLFSFTKSFAIPGVRLGYVICSDRRFLESMSQKAQCWNVSVIAQTAGIAALDCKAWLDKTTADIQLERVRLSKILSDCGLKVYKSNANFVLIYSDINMPQELMKKGIKVRDCSDYVGLCKGYFRIAVKTKTENNKLLEAIKEIQKNKFKINS